MFDFIYTVFMFFVTIGILVVIHEFGHFWVARRVGVKVLRFSVGFGKPLWIWRRKNDPTEYVLAPWPLGGYVKMLDDREGPVPEHEQHQEFNRQSLSRRTAIVLAGPIANLIFAIFAFWLMFMLGVQGFKPVIGVVAPQSIAASSGLKSGDEILQVASNITPTWEAARYALLDRIMSRQSVDLTVRQHDYGERKIRLQLAQLVATPEPGRDLDAIGISPWRPIIPAIIGYVEPSSAAEIQGLQVADRILSQDGVRIKDWDHWVENIKKSPGKQLSLTIDRNGRTENLSVVPAIQNGEQGEFGRLGISPQFPEMPESMKVIEQYGPIDALGQAGRRSWQLSVLTLKMLWKLVTLEASVDNLSGPISIAKYAGRTASIGLSYFLSFLALVSISLFIINLMPIPVLDGGHLVLFVAEGIKGKPVSEGVQVQFRAVGFVMVLLLMSLAIYIDLVRWF